MSNHAAKIASLEKDISSLSHNIKDTQSKIAELKKAKTAITGELHTLSNNANLINQPDITSHIWNGRHTNQFINIRSNIAHGYQNTDGLISHIEQEIENLEMQISNMEMFLSIQKQQLTDIKKQVNH
ncbi:DUF5082 domain-containing protein [Bacillus [licheniformis] CMCC 63516]|uniref:DUF5082 domain-containing protein n=1 Tax=Bacillus paralicheniformis TaxID=1648923 RepID=UPI001374D54F|nr:DUF5082 domain-containing protein [Bacillus paralicheniformis]WOH91328.1 DUF5082 domain-containing protein [Bacillus paralicheniformis]